MEITIPECGASRLLLICHNCSSIVVAAAHITTVGVLGRGWLLRCENIHISRCVDGGEERGRWWWAMMAADKIYFGWGAGVLLPSDAEG